MTSTTMPREKERGFTIIEAAIAMVILLLGAVLVTEALSTSQGAAEADVAKSTAVRDSDLLLRRLGLELKQATIQVDTSLPPGEDQRFFLEVDGVRFQKVIGYDMETDGLVTQRWSPFIRYTFNAAANTVTRQQGGGPIEVVARRVLSLSIQTSADGQVEVQVETEAGAANRGTAAKSRRLIRITPLNALK